MAHTFAGGVHPPEYKEISKGCQIEKAPVPERVVLVLSQHAGAPAQPVVNVRDKVKKGQKVAEAQGFVSANLHSPVSGTVKAITTHLTCTGARATAVLIQTEDDGEEMRLDVRENPSPQDIVGLVREAGIVGLGGAAFPTHVKLSPPEEYPVDTVILNGCECEPYLTVDYRLMIENTDETITGLQLLMTAVGARRAVIGIEDNKPEAIEQMRRAAARGENIEVVSLPTKYPQGSEKHLIKAVLGREVPSGGLPFHVGVLVQNVQTALAVKRAVIDGIPLYERVITVTGQSINRPANLLVPLGMLASDIVEYCGGLRDDTGKVIFGGPMTGFALGSLEVPVVKGTSGIVALPESLVEKYPEEDVCIRCGRCVDVCPARIMPNTLGTLGRLGLIEEAVDNDLMDCIECGSCAYICPARRNLVQYIRYAKAKAREVRS